MKSLDLFISNHKEQDTCRSSFSNLIKKLKLENELYLFIENYLNFGTFNQKLYHYLNNLPKSKLICPVCREKELNWAENKNLYRTTCSKNCSGKLTGTKNLPKREKHPDLYSKEDFIEYFSLNKVKLTESNLSKIYPALVSNINEKIKFDTKIFAEKVYCFLYNLQDRPICKHCNSNQVEFDMFSKGYHDYCSIKCSSNSKDKKEKIEKTCLAKYGVKNISEVTRDKAMKTMFDRYGCNISQTQQYKEKYRNTCLQKYGVEHFSMFDDSNKFKIDNPMKDKYIVEKNLNTKKEKGLIYKWTEEQMKNIKSYRRAVSYYTELSYQKYKHILNPNDEERGIHTNHIDHIFPVISGWKNKIDPKLISHYKNLRLLDSYENLAKGERSDISIDEFLQIINS